MQTIYVVYYLSYKGNDVMLQAFTDEKEAEAYANANQQGYGTFVTPLQLKTAKP